MEKLIRVQRAMAWERAKGELKAILQTYFSDGHDHRKGQFQEMSDAIDAFVQKVEDEGLAE